MELEMKPLAGAEDGQGVVGRCHELAGVAERGVETRLDPRIGAGYGVT
jgi:hypothetical protein